MGRIHKLYLSDTDKKIAGVCGGIGERFEVDSTLVRLGVIFLAFITALFPVLATYIIAAFIIPRRPKTEDLFAEGGVILGE